MKFLSKGPLIICCIGLFLGACQMNQSQSEGSADASAAAKNIPFTKEGTLTIHPSGELPPATIDIEIAETDSARSRGLMQRSSLPPKSGMLFIFEEAAPQSFWMANTPLSLDMFFIDRRGRIVNIAKYTRPGSAKHIRSEEPAQYVLETKAGFADQYGIVAGDSVSWTRTNGK